MFCSLVGKSPPSVECSTDLRNPEGSKTEAQPPDDSTAKFSGLTPRSHDSQTQGNAVDGAFARRVKQHSESRIVATNVSTVPGARRSSLSFTKLLRSKSDGNLGTSVSPLPTAARVQLNSFRKVKDIVGESEDGGDASKPKHKDNVDGQVSEDKLSTSQQDAARGDKLRSDTTYPPAQSETHGAEESDTFLNASIQLLHLQSEARQRVRQLWLSLQRLGRENQIGEAGVELLYTELTAIMRNLNAEKLEGAKYVKSGHLMLLPTPTLASDGGSNGGTGGAGAKGLFGSRSGAQRVWCTLSEDQSKFEMVTVRQEELPSTGSANALTGAIPIAAPVPVVSSSLSRFALPTKASLFGMISDAFQREPTVRTILLQGCQTHKLPLTSRGQDASGLTAADGEDGDSTMARESLHRFQLLVPCKTPASASSTDGGPTDPRFSTLSAVAYELLTFEAVTPTTHSSGDDAEAEAEVSDWVNVLDRVMIQIVKDLERDQILLDDRLFGATSSRGANAHEHGDVEQDNMSEVVKYVVKKVLEFEKEIGQHRKVSGTTGPPQPPSSPAHRFAKNSEARALTFVERVLRGSSRTQSGGDIYDAISFFCQQQNMSICPVSHDARPVQMRLVTDVVNGLFQVEVQVYMRFKVIELTPSSPTAAASTVEDDNAFLVTEPAGGSATDSPHGSRDGLSEWAVVEGTLSRQFTLGKLSTPGSVTIDYVRSEDAWDWNHGMEI
ncbi:hypothetical protein BBJ28_00019412 [Nothophytophthora sp. Chile5]|nr:hypothetical protein BBJ28_00019412 [Nothophytophthora sp. Chile5]